AVLKPAEPQRSVKVWALAAEAKAPSAVASVSAKVRCAQDAPARTFGTRRSGWQRMASPGGRGLDDSGTAHDTRSREIRHGGRLPGDCTVVPPGVRADRSVRRAGGCR